MALYYEKTLDGHRAPITFSSDAITPSLINMVTIRGVGTVPLDIKVDDILWFADPGCDHFWWRKVADNQWRRINPKNDLLGDLQDRPDRPKSRPGYW